MSSTVNQILFGYSLLLLLPVICHAFTGAPSIGRRLQSTRSSHGWRSPWMVLKSTPKDDGDKIELNSQVSLDQMGLNELQTLLRNAVQLQDFEKAGQLSNELMDRLWKNNPPSSDEERKQRRRRMSWRGLGAAPWLVDRLDSLNYTFPTTIQINAMEGVNAIINNTDQIREETSLEERVSGLVDQDMGIVVSGTTGSGKTLAYLVPLLSTLSDSLFTRQRVRVGAEESVDVGDKTDDMLARVALVTSPQVRSNSRKQVSRQNGAIATGAALSTLGKSGTNVKDPLALIVVPTRELGVQTALMLYELVGGNIKKEAMEMSGKKNMFKYKGPKGIKIGCILDDEEASFGLKLQTDVAITTPKYLSKLIADNDVDPSKLRVVIYDEADLALEETNAKDLDSLFNDDPEERDYSRIVFLVGASVTESLGNLAVKSRVLPEGKSYIATATRFAPLEQYEPDEEGDGSLLVGSQSETASLKDLDVCLDPGLKHERVVVANNTGLLSLARLLRKELKNYEDAVAKGTNTTERPRVVVFFPNEEEARKSMDTLRDAMWGEHKLCVLLPKSGVRPLAMMEDFKAGKTSVMLATPNSVRGLDFPALTHVYTLYLPMDDPREYVHLAGRVGRVGQTGSVLGGGGRVVSVLKEEDAEKMEKLAKELNFEFVDVQPVSEEIVRTKDGTIDLNKTKIEDVRRLLEDTMTLVNLADDLGIDLDQLDDDANADIDDEDDEEDEDEDDEEEEEDAYQ